MVYINLHTHSNYSDGTLSPKDVIKLAKSKNVKYLSLTDHDNVGGYDQIDKETLSDINFITGIEISTKEHDYLHILGYKININNDDFKKKLCEWRERRIIRVKEIIKKLNEIGIKISFEDLEINDISTVGRPHIADALVRKGYGSTRTEVFHKYLIEGRYAYVEPMGPTIKQSITAIKEAGGIAVLAHPSTIEGSFNVENVIKDYEFDGIEAYYPSHTNSKIRKYLDIAKRYNLIITAGTDFHGPQTDRDIMDMFVYDENIFSRIFYE